MEESPSEIGRPTKMMKADKHIITMKRLVKVDGMLLLALKTVQQQLLPRKQIWMQTNEKDSNNTKRPTMIMMGLQNLQSLTWVMMPRRTTMMKKTPIMTMMDSLVHLQ